MSALGFLSGFAELAAQLGTAVGVRLGLVGTAAAIASGELTKKSNVTMAGAAVDQFAGAKEYAEKHGAAIDAALGYKPHGKNRNSNSERQTDESAGATPARSETDTFVNAVTAQVVQNFKPPKEEIRSRHVKTIRQEHAKAKAKAEAEEQAKIQKAQEKRLRTEKARAERASAKVQEKLEELRAAESAKNLQNTSARLQAKQQKFKVTPGTPEVAAEYSYMVDYWGPGSTGYIFTVSNAGSKNMIINSIALQGSGVINEAYPQNCGSAGSPTISGETMTFPTETPLILQPGESCMIKGTIIPPENIPFTFAPSQVSVGAASGTVRATIENLSSSKGPSDGEAKPIATGMGGDFCAPEGAKAAATYDCDGAAEAASYMTVATYDSLDIDPKTGEIIYQYQDGRQFSSFSSLSTRNPWLSTGPGFQKSMDDVTTLVNNPTALANFFAKTKILLQQSGNTVLSFDFTGLTNANLDTAISFLTNLRTQMGSALNVRFKLPCVVSTIQAFDASKLTQIFSLVTTAVAKVDYGLIGPGREGQPVGAIAPLNNVVPFSSQDTVTATVNAYKAKLAPDVVSKKLDVEVPNELKVSSVASTEDTCGFGQVSNGSPLWGSDPYNCGDATRPSGLTCQSVPMSPVVGASGVKAQNATGSEILCNNKIVGNRPGKNLPKQVAGLGVGVSTSVITAAGALGLLSWACDAVSSNCPDAPQPSSGGGNDSGSIIAEVFGGAAGVLLLIACFRYINKRTEKGPEGQPLLKKEDKKERLYPDVHSIQVGSEDEPAVLSASQRTLSNVSNFGPVRSQPEGGTSDEGHGETSDSVVEPPLAAGAQQNPPSFNPDLAGPRVVIHHHYHPAPAPAAAVVKQEPPLASQPEAAVVSSSAGASPDASAPDAEPASAPLYVSVPAAGAGVAVAAGAPSDVSVIGGGESKRDSASTQGVPVDAPPSYTDTCSQEEAEVALQQVREREAEDQRKREADAQFAKLQEANAKLQAELDAVREQNKRAGSGSPHSTSVLLGAGAGAVLSRVGSRSSLASNTSSPAGSPPKDSTLEGGAGAASEHAVEAQQEGVPSVVVHVDGDNAEPALETALDSPSHRLG